ncbi:MAG: AAA family ATPase [Phycisphaerae bacterium]|nr:AAA family ATPase [Phycisphaerae bacterium]
MRTVAIINQKGGCGKTTVAINLASALAAENKKTLLVDIDPQGHCAVGLAVPEEQIEQSIYDVLISSRRGEPVKPTEILWEIGDNFELAPASIDLAAFEQQTNGVTDRENCLKDVLKTVEQDFDYVVVDCPPAVGILTFNAIRASTDVIVPVETGYFSLHGLSRQLDTLSVLCKQCSQHINVMVLASMYDIRTKMGREILADLRKHFSGRMFQTVVNFNTKLKEAASLGQPICEYDPASRGHKDFQCLAQELIATDTMVEPKQIASAIQKTEPQTQIVEKSQDRKEIVKNFDDKLDAISSSAQELMASLNEPQPKTRAKIMRDIDGRLNDFYGTRQFGGAVKFVTLYPRARSVQIAGDFNNWQPQQTTMKPAQDGKWELALTLAPGKYRYRMVVDGQWQQDPYNEQVEMNPFGEFNSVLEVK